MNDNRLKAYQLKKCHILDYMVLKILVQHSRSAVLYDDLLAVKLLDVRKRLDEGLGPLFRRDVHVVDVVEVIHIDPLLKGARQVR